MSEGARAERMQAVQPRQQGIDGGAQPFDFAGGGGHGHEGQVAGIALVHGRLQLRQRAQIALDGAAQPPCQHQQQDDLRRDGVHEQALQQRGPA